MAAKSEGKHTSFSERDEKTIILMMRERASIEACAMRLRNLCLTWAKIPIYTRDMDGRIKEAPIKIADYKFAESSVVEQDTVVVADTEIKIEFEYPLDAPVTFGFKSRSGFTRGMLLYLIVTSYKQIYAEEERTVKKKPVLGVGERKPLINRNDTDGKYQIWGHDISDLWLESISYCQKNCTIMLGIGS